MPAEGAKRLQQHMDGIIAVFGSGSATHISASVLLARCLEQQGDLQGSAMALGQSQSQSQSQSRPVAAQAADGSTNSAAMRSLLQQGVQYVESGNTAAVRGLTQQIQEVLDAGGVNDTLVFAAGQFLKLFGTR